MPTEPSRPNADADIGVPRADLNEPPPLLGTWRRVYTLVLVSQAALVVIFYAMTRYYA